jgi:hypothetical protein
VATADDQNQAQTKAQQEAEMKSVSGQVLQSCQQAPTDKKPSIPNGMQASKDDMITAMHAVKAYNAKGYAYLDCLDKLQTSWGKDVTPTQKQIIAIFHNKVVKDMQDVADLFNQALRAYKGRSSD